MANTRETMGEQACLDALVAGTLTSFEDDGVTNVGAYCLQRHTTLAEVTLPACRTVNLYAMYYNSNLEKVDILGTGRIDTDAFSNAKMLRHLIMRGTTKTTLSLYTAFQSTWIASGLGAVYVDESVIDSYRADSSWNKYVLATIDEYPITDFSTIEDSWSTIISKAEDGTASQSYSIGDTKLIDLGTEGKVYAQIAAFDADVLASDSTKTAGITFILYYALPTQHRMNPTNSSGTQGTGANGGWEYCEMRTYLNETILQKMPAEIQSAVKSVTKYSSNIEPGKTSLTTNGCVTQDKLWLPSIYEVNGETKYESIGPRYNSLFTGYDQLKKVSVNGRAIEWVMRSASAQDYFCTITSQGGRSQTGCGYDCYVVFGFCI